MQNGLITGSCRSPSNILQNGGCFHITTALVLASHLLLHLIVMMSSAAAQSDRLSDSRKLVLTDYAAAEQKNLRMYKKGDPCATSEYIYDNQKQDARNIIEIFRAKADVRVISVIKRTKVGMDGLMIEIIKNMTTDEDDEFCIPYENCAIWTGMSNVKWERQMKEKSPRCFTENIHHRGQLKKVNLESFQKNSLIIIDEIDTGDKQGQTVSKMINSILHGDSSVDTLKERNIRIIVVSATMEDQLNCLMQWGIHHENYMMTTPENYMSHKDFLVMGYIQEFYPVVDETSAERWVFEDIVTHWKDNPRVHFIRTHGDKYYKHIENACEKYSIKHKKYTSKKNETISMKEMSEIFKNVTEHLVIITRGMLKRSDFIPNEWKMKIGAMHEYCSPNMKQNTIDSTLVRVQNQAFPGRASGYWKHMFVCDDPHVIGPIRTSIAAIIDYENFLTNPISFLKTKVNKEIASRTFLQPAVWNIEVHNLVPKKSLSYADSKCLRGPIPFYMTPEEMTSFCSSPLKRRHERTIDIILAHDEVADLHEFVKVVPKFYSHLATEESAAKRLVEKNIEFAVKKRTGVPFHGILGNQKISPLWKFYVDYAPSTRHLNRAVIFVWDPRNLEKNEQEAEHEFDRKRPREEEKEEEEEHMEPKHRCVRLEAEEGEIIV